MSASKPDASAGSYSPFWALVVVFAVLILLQCAYLRDGVVERASIRAASLQLQPALANARTVSETAEALGRDLLKLATNSTEAAKIVAEFNIQLHAPTNAPAATAPKSK